ncbi:hypothetical protein SGM_5577 [Streptomyces griseoaurantiacus M045]|uniref:Uncharacterized protein n=1 Tax=Streptomyces griseoaurantiacus M045 TaxID=996637 RepID=F3NR13_9ACTN|nr:hypothetical protein SGM_5577 [Streptomyces griseoaurantiacus M045]
MPVTRRVPAVMSLPLEVVRSFDSSRMPDLSFGPFPDPVVPALRPLHTDHVTRVLNTVAARGCTTRPPPRGAEEGQRLKWRGTRESFTRHWCGYGSL